MIGRLARGFGMSGITAGSVTDAGSAQRSGWTTLGALPMVASQGVQRWATYRAIYLTNPWVYASVNLLSRSIGRLPLHVYELDAKARKSRVRCDVNTRGSLNAGQKLDRFLQRPAGGISRNAMYAGTMVDRLTYGNALWEIERDRGFPVAPRRVKWRDTVQVIPDSDGAAMAYKVRQTVGMTTRGERTISAADVIHFGLGSDPEGVYGISPLESCRHTLALHEALVRHLISYFQNSARPSGVFQVEKIDKARMDEMRNLLTELYSSPENAGKILMTTGKWQEIGHSPDHSSIVELVRLSREEIVAVYGVPPPVAGILEQAIKSNVKELREQFGRDSVGPNASDFESDLMAQLVYPQPSWTGLFAEFELAELLRPDLEARALVYQRMAPFFSIDEVRGFENRPAFDIAGVTDVPLIPRGVSPAGSEPAPPPPGRPADPPADPAASSPDE